MSFVASASGRACLADWDSAISVNDVLTLLFALKRAVGASGSPTILLVVVREVVPVPGQFLLNCLRGALPALLDSCEQIAFVVEGASAERATLRAAFQPLRQASSKRLQPRTFDSLSAAFAHVQRFAPHDVLELQRHLLRQSFPPDGQLT
jgi:hypothetical protein